MTIPYGYPETPAVVAGPQEENSIDVQLPGLLPDLQTNWATNQEVINMVKNEVIPAMEWCRQQRRELEEEWRAVRRMLLLQHDEGQRYIGRSNAYLPIYSRAHKSLVSKVSRGLFPSDEYMDVACRTGDPATARPVKDYLQYEFEKVARLRSNIKPFLAEFFNNGISVAKYWYEPRKLAKRRVGKIDFNKILNQVSAQYAEDYSREGLRFSTRSVFNWYVYPVTVASLREASLCFEDISVTRQFVDEMIRQGEWVKISPDQLSTGGESNYKQNEDEALIAAMGNSNQANLGGNFLADTRVFSEVWARMILPKKAYAQGEDADCPVPVKICVSNGIVLSVRRNPFWHQDFPYLVARANVLPGSFYPKGEGHTARYLQYLANDFMNQMNDAGSYALNPVVKINPGLMAGNLPPIRPGVVWPMTDIERGVSFDRPPMDIVQGGQGLVGMVSGMLQDFIGAPPVTQGIAAGKGAKTATGAQILQANANNPIQDLIEDIENDVLMPLMHGAWVLGQQFRDGTVMDEIAGAPIKVSREQLFGDFTFRWLASSQAANQQQRAAQMMQLLQTVMPMVPLLVQLGYKVDPVPVIKRIASDGFGLRGFDQFISQMNPMMQQMQMGMPQQVGTSEQVPTEGNNYSAVPNSGLEMQPGEGEEFANVRDNADQLAAMLGGMGGGIE